MENKIDYKLIDGTFSPLEAEKIIIALFNYKIDYHNKEDFSNHVRFNKDIEYSKKRIEKLIETKEVVQKLLYEAKINNTNLVINSTITVSIEK